MRAQLSFFSTALTVALGVAPSARAESLCFNFEKKYEVTPLREAPRGAEDTSELGVMPDKATYWAAHRGEVALPIEKVLRLLWQHEVVRDSSVVEATFQALDPGRYVLRQKIRQVAKRFIFTAEWVEDWAAAVTEGTPEAPQTVVVSSQKTEGTSHIQHLCSNIVLRRVPKGTEMSLYQEAKITRRSAETILETLKRKLSRFRALQNSASASSGSASKEVSATQ